MEWIYVFFHKPTGHLIDENGDCVIFGKDGKTPVVFTDAGQASDYLENEGIRATVAA